MPTIHVSSLSRLHETVAATGASHVVTLINAKTPVERPASIAADRHLFIGVSDIVAPMDGHILPGEEHVLRLNQFVDLWDRSRPLVIHCWAGISRSTAAAYITACRLRPHHDELLLARRLRQVAPSATPNLKLVATADALLGRKGRMIAAIESIGRGADAFEGTPFEMPLD
jgi:predicted protein tyrosine phosphatase